MTSGTAETPMPVEPSWDTGPERCEDTRRYLAERDAHGRVIVGPTGDPLGAVEWHE